VFLKKDHLLRTGPTTKYTLFDHTPLYIFYRSTRVCSGLQRFFC